MTLRKKDPYRPPDDALWFLPLGGSGEIGMNLNLYGTEGRWLMVDCGVSFPDETMPGIEIVMPDISFIVERRDALLGMVITHGHEDHLGAIEHLWPHLQCPVFATPFTLEMIRSKLAEAGLKGQVDLIELPMNGTFDLGPFKGEMIHVTHSIPESHMVALTTKHGTILHTGDWKFDADPIVGDVTNERRLKELGRHKLMALVGDSTNALEPGFSDSELTAQKGLCDVFGRFRHRIAVTCFSRSIARLKSVAVAAQKHGRYVGLVGRSLWRNAEIAESCGYLPEFSQFLSEHEAMQAPRDKIVLICTGCQGEPRSALSRIASFDHPAVEFDTGDAVVFSSSDIPGNEKAIGRVQNILIRQGIEVVTERQAPVHASGHAKAGDMAQLIAWTRPGLVVPVHGELRHQTGLAKIASESGVPASLIPENGQLIRLGPGIHEVVAEIPSGRIGLDGKILRRLDRETVKHRRKLGYNGAVVVTLVLDRRGRLMSDAQVTLLGIEDEQYVKPLREDMACAVMDAVEGISKASRTDDGAVQGAIRQAARRFLHESHGKKPVIEVHLVRV